VSIASSSSARLPSAERLIITVVRCLFTELPEKERVLKKVVRGARTGGSGAGLKSDRACRAVGVRQ
jgi:hypothetical protein